MNALKTMPRLYQSHIAARRMLLLAHHQQRGRVMSNLAIGVIFLSCIGTLFMIVGAALLFGVGGALLAFGAGIMLFTLASALAEA